MPVIEKQRQSDTSAWFGATKMLAQFVCKAEIDEFSRRHAARAFIDTLGVTIAGGAEQGIAKLESLFEPVSGRTGIACPWNGRFYPPQTAALVIGTASHVLDYDDVSMLAVCHPSAPILSAILAAATRETSGADVLDALVVGTEVLIRLGQAMGFRHYAIGFHATATLGAVGAAAACSRILRLDEKTTQNALAIAASHSCGLRKNFGTMVKSIHVGLAASSGLQAARMARAGLDGANEVIEGEGFLYAFSGAETDHWPQSLMPGRPFVIADPGFEQKRYPCCYQLHKMIEATLGLRREHGIALDDVVSVRVDMVSGATKPLIHPFPKSGLNALFSGPYAVTAALEDGQINLKSFTDEAVLRPRIQSRLKDVALVEGEPEGGAVKNIGDAPVRVSLTLKGGRTLSRSVVVSPGSMEDPLTETDLEAKWIDCLQRARPDLSSSAARALFADGMAIGSMPSISLWLDKVIDAAGSDDR